MTKPTGTADEILNLPAGGGSVSGSGTGFSVDLNTGALTASFELTLPCGPNGIVPPMSLRYSSTSGDGPFGLGWTLGTLAVLAKVSPGSQDAPGAYTMTGVGDLIDMGGGRWRPTVDATGQLIELTGGSWTVTDNRDTSFTLGTTAGSRIGSPPVAWLLDSSSDSSGNTISYGWRDDQGTLLPDTVTWGTYQLVFVYQDRPDLLVSGAYGATVLTTQRCRAIELHVSTETPSLVRSWSLRYDDDAGLGRSFLAAITEQGHGADGSVLAAPDRTFSYTRAQASQLRPVTGWMSALDDADTDLVDLNGDGLPDVLTLGAGRPTMRPNLGGGRFGFPQPLSQAPSALRLSSPNVAFADMTGEGNADLLVLDQPFAGYFPLSAPGGAAPSGFGRPVTFGRAPDLMPGSPQVRLVDLNGDGLTDVLFDSGRGWLEYLRVTGSSWSQYPVILPAERTPPVSLTDPHVYLADMTGDGLTDVVRVSGGGVTYWPARADGGWDQAIAMSPAPHVGQGWEPERLALFDVDGDGCADLVYVGPASVTVWFNTGANRLSAPMIIDHTPLAPLGGYRLVDLFGSGTTGILFELPPLGSAPVRQAFLDLAGGVKPGLIARIQNGEGYLTTVTWQPSTEFALGDARAGVPWATYHPFPVQCVTQTDQADLGSGVTTTVRYAYHDGRYDPGTRLFLGFGRVDSEQAGDASCPALRTETSFHLGLDPADPTRPLPAGEAFSLGALRRKVLSTTVRGLDGSAEAATPYSVTTNLYSTLVVSAANGHQIAVPYTVSTTEQRWERQAAPISTRVISYGVVDDEGDITQQRTTATRTGAAAADQDVITTITYAAGGRNLRLPARVTQTAADGSVIGANVTYYDGDPYLGLPEGQASAGLVTRIEDLAFTPGVVAAVWGAAPPDLAAYGYHRLPGDDANWWVTRRASQRQTTADGPRITTRGPLGAEQAVQLDPAGQRVVAVSDAVGNVLTATIDNRVWQTASVTDQNGNTVTDMFDPLGRVTATVQPGDSPALPWAGYQYLAGTISTATSAARIEHGQPGTFATRTYLDGSGHTMGTAQPTATSGDWVISGAAQRNAMGLVSRTWLPYQVTGDAWQPAPPGTGSVSIGYDAVGRVVRKTRADGLIVATRREGSDLVFSEQWPPGPPADVERQSYDAAGQLVSVSRNDGGHWVSQTYQYTSSGRMSVVTLPNGLQAWFYYDLLGRRIGHRSPDTGLTTYLLDACGNERLRTIATGQQVRTEVDAMNRVTGVYYDAEPSPRVSYSYYDQGAAVPGDGVTANRAGRVWRVTDELGTVTLHYAEAGLVSGYTRQVASTGDTYTETYSFDALGRTTSVTLPPTTAGDAGRTVDYSFGPDGRLASASGVVTNATYDVMGRPTTLEYENGCRTLIDYRPNGGAVGRIRVTDASGGTIRDLAVTVTDSLVDGLVSATADDDSATFGYDGLRRLASAAYAGGSGPLDDHSWSYGDDFTVSTSSDAGVLAYAPGTHQLSSVAGSPVSFDAAGRMSAARFGQLAFDPADHLSQVRSPQGQLTSHVYGYTGARVSTVAGGTQTYLAPSDNFVIKDGRPVAWISFGPIQVAAEIGGALWYLHGNALGGTDLITDASGHEAGRIRLTPYGLARTGAGPPPAGDAGILALLLAGTDGTGLICLGQRWYDPVVGQFISPDLVVNGIYTMGVWNPYLYCLGNPVSLCDPAGTDFWTVLEIIGVAVLAAACVVAAIWTGGASLVALGVLTANLSTAMLVGVSIGALGGAIAGELAAQKAGGNIWAGAFMGAVLGGVTSLAGGVLGGMVGGALKALPLLEYVVSGAVQGAIAGMGTGMAVGYAGGKGNAEQMFLHAATGALWGASLGALLGLGTYFVAASPPPVSPGQQPGRPYLQIGSINQLNPAAAQTSAGLVGAVNNQLTLGNDIAAMGTNASGANSAGLLAEFAGTRYLADDASVFFSNGALVKIPLGWVPNAVLNGGAFAALVNVSFAADQAGFSFADQLTKILKMTPVGWLMTVFVEGNPGDDYNQAADGLNQLLGSADPNEYP